MKLNILNNDKEKVIFEEKYDCPFCDHEHEVIVKRRLSKCLVKKEPVEYIETVYYCPQEDEEFTPEDISKQNLFNAREAYRKKYNLLTVQDIKAIRNKYGLSQKELANLMGWGNVTISRYESKSIQDESHNSLLKIVYEQPWQAWNFLEDNKNQFNLVRYNEIKNNLKNIIQKHGIKYQYEEFLKNQYIDYNQPSNINGNKCLDIDKIKNIIAYFAHFISPLYKIKLMHLLWYCDVLYYKQKNSSMTGLVYQHISYGISPIGFNEILQLPTIEVEEELQNEYLQYKIKSRSSNFMKQFNLEEQNILSNVAITFQNFDTKTLLQYIQNEIPYRKTLEKEIIDYDLAKKIKDLPR